MLDAVMWMDGGMEINSSTRTSLSGEAFHNLETHPPVIQVSPDEPRNMRKGLERLMEWLNEREQKATRPRD